MANYDDLAPTLAWLQTRLPQFDPFPRGAQDFYSLKAFAELSIAFLYLSEAGARAPECLVLSGFLDQCFTFLANHIERPVYLEAARKQPLKAYAFILPYLALRCTGHRSSRHEELLDWLGGLGLPLSVETVPYRDWDRTHFLWKSGYCKAQPVQSRMYRSTRLATISGALYCDEDDAYAITHTIFYMTDFGLQPPAVSAKENRRIVALLKSLLVHYWRVEHWDLMGEILTCLQYMRSAEEPLLQEAKDSFAGLLRGDGTIPAVGPRSLPKRHRRRGKGHQPITGLDHYTRSCYHSTFVWILYSLSLRIEPCTPAKY